MEEMPILAAEIENNFTEISTTWPILPIENFLWGLAVTISKHIATSMEWCTGVGSKRKTKKAHSS